MTSVWKLAPTAALLSLLAVIPAASFAQDQPRLRLSFAPAVATVSGDAELALGGTVGYRFSDHFWFEGDVTWIDAAAGGFRSQSFDMDGRQMSWSDTLSRVGGLFGGRRSGLRFPDFPNVPTIPDRFNASIDGSTFVATLGLRYEFPVQTARFRPYVSGGLGINTTDQEVRVEATSLTSAIERSLSHTGYAFNAGAGASVRVFQQLWADVDAKYFRLSQDRNVMRLGGGVSVRF